MRGRETESTRARIKSNLYFYRCALDVFVTECLRFIYRTRYKTLIFVCQVLGTYYPYLLQFIY